MYTHTHTHAKIKQFQFTLESSQNISTAASNNLRYQRIHSDKKRLFHCQQCFKIHTITIQPTSILQIAKYIHFKRDYRVRILCGTCRWSLHRSPRHTPGSAALTTTEIYRTMRAINVRQ